VPGLLAGLRGRLVLTVIAVLLLSEVIAFVAVRELLITRTDERVEASLQGEVREFRALAESPQSERRTVEQVFDVFLARNVVNREEAIFAFLDDGEPYRSTLVAAPSPRLERQLRRLGATRRLRRGELVAGRGTLRYVAVPIRRGDRRGALVVLANVSRRQQEVSDALRVVTIVSLILLVLSAALTWLLAGRVLAPLHALHAAVQSIRDTDLTRRIDVRGRDEVAELARQFNAMLERLEAAFASQRAFVSDAGHELRTPITIIRGHLELMGDDPQERRDTVELVTDELDRMNRFVDDLLTLARAERPDFLHVQDLDVATLVDELAVKATALAPRDWRVVVGADGLIRADRQRLTQAVMNLAQNAVQHTGPGDRIAVGADALDGDVCFWVRDSGPGVAPADRERIFERFARGRDAGRRSDGAGLGLAIVRAIAEAHGGTVTVDGEPGEGATFTLRLPRRAPRGAPLARVPS